MVEVMPAFEFGVLSKGYSSHSTELGCDLVATWIAPGGESDNVLIQSYEHVHVHLQNRAHQIMPE